MVIGKYGTIWMRFMEEKYPMRYLELHMDGELRTKAAEINEEAIKVLDIMVQAYLKKHKPKNPDSTMVEVRYKKKLGVFQCYQKIHNLIQDNIGDCLMAEVVESFLRTGETDLPEQFGKYNPKRTIFNHDIRANAKGYEYYCYMLLRHQNQRK